MTKEEAKKLLPFFEAYAEGKVNVEYKRKDTIDWMPMTSSTPWCLDYDYRVKAKPKYVPFESANEMYEAIRKHGAWVHISTENYKDIYAIHTIDNRGVLIGDDSYGVDHSFDEMANDYVWADDGTPCGKLI